MTSATLLGPQRLQPRLSETAALMGLDGPIAAITAGWEEREGEDDELREELPTARNLRLFERTEDIFAKDPELLEAMRERHDELRSLQKLYRLRLDHAMQAARDLAERFERTPLVEQELTDAISAVATLDAHHLQRVAAVHTRYRERWRPRSRPAVRAAREDVARELEGCAGVAIAGGHVVVLLNRLRLLNLPTLIEGLPVMAWSAGAMVLTERIVLFHDMPPQGRGNAEVLENGLGLVKGVVALPHAKRRLLLDDPVRVSLLARRFAPALSAPLDEGCGIRWADGRWQPLPRGRKLELDGRVTELLA